MEQTIKEIEVNIIYSWYLGYELDKKYLILSFLEKIPKKTQNFTKRNLKKKLIWRKKIIKKTLNFDKPIKEKRIKQSTTNMECSTFHKDKYKKVFEYSANTASNKNNFVLYFVVNPSNIHDSKAFQILYENKKINI